MNKNSFEIRQKAEDLLREATGIWRQSDRSDYLEGLENDPVFKLLMMAVAYQAGETEDEIERLKSDVLDEFSRVLLPYMAGHAVPACVAVSVGMEGSVDYVTLNSDSVFGIAGTNYQFLPLLKSKAFNAAVRSVTRMDGRRWKVEMEFAAGLEDLEGFSFVVRGSDFSDLKVYAGGVRLPLNKPWETVNLPYSDAFSLDTMLFNRSEAYDASISVSDLFNSQDLSLFSIASHSPQDYGYVDRNTVELEFEFEGITADYPFSREQLVLNPVILVNAAMKNAQLSASSPFARIGGEDCQFLHLVRPSADLAYQNSILQVRKVAADRFNRSSLVKLLSSLTAKFSSDFYAFQDINSRNGDKLMRTLNSLVSRLKSAAEQDGAARSSGTYLILRQGPVGNKGDINLSVSYLTTDGAAVNAVLREEYRFTAPLGIDSGSIATLAAPVEGRDELSPTDCSELVSFYIATNNRIVTPADIRLFCTSELMVRYGINQSMLKSVRVRREQDFSRDCGYQIIVSIQLKDNSFVRRCLGGNPAVVASRMEKMMRSRSAGIYPVKVALELMNDNK